jgi:hypothetical protein
MNTWWSKRRFTLCSPDLCAQVEKLAASCGETTRTYLAELVEISLYEKGQKADSCPTVVDDLVASWLSTHRSGRPCTIVPVTSPSEDCYFLPRGVTIADDWAAI